MNIQKGRSNEAFEGLEDEVGPNDRSKPTISLDHQVPETTNQIEDQTCRLFGLLPLPQCFQNVFLSAGWILVFLSLAATIQV